MVLPIIFCIVAALLKHPRTPPLSNPAIMDYTSGDSDHISKRSRPIVVSDEVCCSVSMQLTRSLFYLVRVDA